MSGAELYLAVVRKRWSDAHAWAGHTEGEYRWHVNQSTRDGNPVIGTGPTELLALRDAAEKVIVAAGYMFDVYGYEDTVQFYWVDSNGRKGRGEHDSELAFDAACQDYLEVMG